MSNADIRNYLTADELSQWDLIRFCIEGNFKRDLALRIAPLYVDAQQAEQELRFDLAAMLRTIAQQVLATLEQEKVDRLTAELEGFLATLRDRERANTIECLQDEILRTASSDS